MLFYSNGEKYEGQILKNKENGFGTLYKLSINKIYEGEFSKGLKHGKGKLIIDEKTGSSYEGNFLEDQFHGKGLLINNKIRYEGDFKSGKFHGIGINIDFKGEAYEGQFENGKKNGILNKYNMQIDSSCVYKDDKLIESHEKEKNSDDFSLLSRKNLTETPENFKLFSEKMKNQIKSNGKLFNKLVNMDMASILNEKNKFSYMENETAKSEKLKELMNFKDLNKIEGSRMSSISGDMGDDIDINSLKGNNFMKNYNSNEGNNLKTNYSDGNLNTEGSANPNADPNCLIF